MVAQDGIPQQLNAIGGWSQRFEELYDRIAGEFARSEARHRAKHYLLGLLGTVERKNSWRLAEDMGETTPQGTQHLLNSADWDADAVRDDLREYVVEHLEDEKSGILIVDETGFLKKGDKSVGVERQYTGTAGDTVNCQVGVFMAYASNKGAAFINRALYLPEEWTKDRGRRAEAGVPEQIAFASKIGIAKEMLERAFEAEVPVRWVTADAFYGRSHEFRQCGDGSEDQRRPARRPQEEDRATRRVPAGRRLRGDISRSRYRRETALAVGGHRAFGR